jgi:tRNA dimethylallyltransferase
LSILKNVTASSHGIKMAQLIIIGGATATGKSDLSLCVAQHFGAEIINADSMQLYKGMDIGTAKLSREERLGITHHLLDEVEVNQDLNVAWYQEQARELIDNQLAAGKNVVVVGGTGLYIKAILDDLDFPDTDPHIRSKWEAIASQIGAQELHAILAEQDPAAAIAIPANNVRKVVRALEVISITGKPFTARLPRKASERYPSAYQFACRMEKSELDARIALRTQKMFDLGLQHEVEALIAKGLTDGRTAQAAIGYSHVIKALDGEFTIAQAKELTEIATRQYARRQYTWFERDERVTWLTPLTTQERLAEIIKVVEG